MARPIRNPPKSDLVLKLTAYLPGKTQSEHITITVPNWDGMVPKAHQHGLRVRQELVEALQAKYGLKVKIGPGSGK